MTIHHARTRPMAAAALMLVAGLAIAGCGGNSASSSKSGTDATPTVLPVKSNPIQNDSTEPGLEITSVLVENNVDPDTGKDAPDHLEIELHNSGTKTLDGFEVYYEVVDPSNTDSEGYHTVLDPSFSIEPDATRTVHFDDSSAPDHYPDNAYSLYHTSTNKLDVEVTVSAAGAAPQTASVTKDAGGAENPDE